MTTKFKIYLKEKSLRQLMKSFDQDGDGQITEKGSN